MTAVYVQVATQNMMQIVIWIPAVFVLVLIQMILDVAVLSQAHLDVIIHVALLS